MEAISSFLPPLLSSLSLLSLSGRS
uniref:Uncharacterized protein n=1 Tax=Anguilla anguilla TaxID=7936 RepID=A0A0E9PKN9_ANGAN